MRMLWAVLSFLPLVGCASKSPATEPSTDHNEAAPPVVTAPVEQTPAETPAGPAFTSGPGGFPLPTDAVDGGDVPGGGGAIKLYKLPRGRQQVADELRALFAANGWTIDAESGEPEPRPAVRFQVSKDGKQFKASVAGDDTQAGIILTLPKASPAP